MEVGCTAVPLSNLGDAIGTFHVGKSAIPSGEVSLPGLSHQDTDAVCYTTLLPGHSHQDTDAATWAFTPGYRRSLLYYFATWAFTPGYRRSLLYHFATWAFTPGYRRSSLLPAFRALLLIPRTRQPGPSSSAEKNLPTPLCHTVLLSTSLLQWNSLCHTQFHHSCNGWWDVLLCSWLWVCNQNPSAG